MKPFLFEIGVEELPARFIQPAKEGLLKLLGEGLDTARIDHGRITVYGTPRRIAALIDNVAEMQRDNVTVKYGPPAAKAFDAEGNPQAAAIGFAKSQGIDVSELKIVKKDANELICVEKLEKGRSSLDVLPDLLAGLISRIPFAKKMRWGAGDFEFARPIQWLVALLGEAVIPITVAGITSGNRSRGHRFLSKGLLTITHPSRYVEDLKAAFVIVNEAERLATMMEGIRAIEGETGGRAVTDDALIQEILYITEYPYAQMGRFEADYLDLPRAALVNVMKGHQRYIPLEGPDGALLAAFVFFANTIPKDPQQVTHGNEKVLRARLADARFFFEEDKKVKLETLYEKLSAVVFHERLGNLKEKSERISQIALSIGKEQGVDARAVGKASELLKADLLTHMVGEFPELQGIMGRIYALAQGEKEKVARSIEEHYYPVGVSGALPESDLGTVMALADKMDTLAAFFSVGITPTGNLDPFALRRQALGFIKIVINRGLHIPLQELIGIAHGALRVKGKLPLETVRQTLTDFILTRFKFSMIEEGHNQEFVNSVLPAALDDIYDGFMRLRALETQKSIEDFVRLMIGFKRVYNITKALTDTAEIDTGLLTDREEKDLFHLYSEERGPYFSAVRAREYEAGLAILVGFKETIDTYFDKVFVMVEDERVRSNRLALLTKIKDMFLTYGDFSKIRVEEISGTSG
ncbi:MAG TPA: glycine--tRNA ligase subunit beta [Syntrophorhabdales bacterium]|nr:glycine--tRNA ligase subunit beta [Syntrophorhabdales bacterium]